jgi:ornithine cyclodeaminase/alanine dehydrogenase-like protein (mu-crystallin family)
MEKATIAFSPGEVIQPPHNMILVTPYRGNFESMQAKPEDAMGIKLVNFHPSDATLSIPAHNAIILLFKPENREPPTIKEGKLITEMRTATISTRPLAAPNAKTLAISGADESTFKSCAPSTILRLPASEPAIWKKRRLLLPDLALFSWTC